MKKSALIVLAALWTGQALAEQKLGVEVYPNAKPDPSVGKAIEKHLKIKGANTYRTSDSVAKVAQFYREQKLNEVNVTDQGAMFTSKSGVNVTIQNPWMDMDKGTIIRDTLITIAK